MYETLNKICELSNLKVLFLDNLMKKEIHKKKNKDDSNLKGKQKEFLYEKTKEHKTGKVKRRLQATC
jgi:hypothetical protein